MNEIVVETLRQGVAVVVLNRPEKRNALTIALMESLCGAVDQCNKDADVRVIILRGAGPAFCAGLDLKEAADVALAQHSAELVARMLTVVAQSPKVVIAAVHGAAVAGGAGLLLACDLAVAAGDTRIGFPEVRRGLVAGMVMTLLRRRVLERDARELLLTGELVNADRALAMGLINRVVTPEALLPAAERFAMDVAEGAPGAVARTKALFNALWPRPLADDIAAALELHKQVRVADEALEGMGAFLEKRPPNWTRPA
jgi:methylglutaconyl-CoA hydratase